MAMAQTAYQARPAVRRISVAAARHTCGAEAPLFQAFLSPSFPRTTEGLCIKDATTIDAEVFPVRSRPYYLKALEKRLLLI